MARKGDIRVVTAKAGNGKVDIPIYYSAARLEFRAVYSGQTFTGATQQEVETAVVAAANESLNVVWTPVIKITIAPWPGEYPVEVRAAVRIEFQRYYVAKVQGRLLKAEWHHNQLSQPDSDALRTARSARLDWKTENPPLVPPLVLHHRFNHFGYGDEWEVYLLFSDRLWDNLHKIQTSLSNVRQNLIDLITTDAGQTELLVALVLPYQPARPAPQETDSHAD